MSGTEITVVLLPIIPELVQTINICTLTEERQPQRVIRNTNSLLLEVSSKRFLHRSIRIASAWSRLWRVIIAQGLMNGSRIETNVHSMLVVRAGLVKEVAEIRAHRCERSGNVLHPEVCEKLRACGDERRPVAFERLLRVVRCAVACCIVAEASTHCGPADFLRFESDGGVHVQTGSVDSHHAQLVEGRDGGEHGFDEDGSVRVAEIFGRGLLGVPWCVSILATRQDGVLDDLEVNVAGRIGGADNVDAICNLAQLVGFSDNTHYAPAKKLRGSDSEVGLRWKDPWNMLKRVAGGCVQTGMKYQGMAHLGVPRADLQRQPLLGLQPLEQDYRSSW